MKTKLTLTVKKNVILSAKKQAKARGVSLSQMFEQMFEEGSIKAIKTESQRAAERLLESLEGAKSIQSSEKSDKELTRKHVDRKYA